jgi:uncharacterized membrane protein
MLMTMEMWQLGFSLSQFRLALLLLVTIPLLVGLSHYMGFEETFGLKDDVVDAFVALAVGFIVSAIGLFLFSILRGEPPSGRSLARPPCKLYRRVVERCLREANSAGDRKKETTRRVRIPRQN